MLTDLTTKEVIAREPARFFRSDYPKIKNNQSTGAEVATIHCESYLIGRGLNLEYVMLDAARVQIVVSAFISDVSAMRVVFEFDAEADHSYLIRPRQSSDNYFDEVPTTTACVLLVDLTTALEKDSAESDSVGPPAVKAKDMKFIASYCHPG